MTVTRVSAGETPSPGPSFREWLFMPFRGNRPFMCAFLWMLLAGVVVRMVMIHYATPLWTASDSRDYHEYARSLMEGRGYCHVYHGEQKAYEGMTFYAYRTPGYPVLLAMVYTLFGWQPLASMLLNVAADLITAFCLAVTTFHCFGRRALLWTQLLWALQAFGAPSQLTESVFTAAFMTLFLLLTYGAPLRSGPGAILFGLLTCVAAFIRPLGICAYPVLGIRMLLTRQRFRRMVFLLALAVLPTALGVSLWAYRNYRILGQPVLFATLQGRTNASDFGIQFSKVYAKARQQGMNEAQINTLLKQSVARKARANPVWALKLYGRRLAGLFWLDEQRDRRSLHLDYLFDAPTNPAWFRRLAYGLFFQYPVVYALAALGLALMLWQRPPFLDGMLLILSYALLQAANVKGYLRYAAPLYPLFIMMAAFALAWATSVLTARRRHASTAPAPSPSAVAPLCERTIPAPQADATESQRTRHT